MVATFLFVLVGCSSFGLSKESSPIVETILTGLENPRGVAVSTTGEIYVAEAGTGLHLLDPTKWDGKLTKFTDLNGDGDFEDEAEVERWFSHFMTYNGFSAYGTGRDEVSGPSDLLLHSDGRLFLSVDDGGLSDSMALHVISPEGRIGLTLADRNNMNGIVFDRDQQKIFAVESGLNTLIEISFSGEFQNIVNFPLLDSGQQAVPAGLTIDPQTGDLLVALFSGYLFDEQASSIDDITSFVAGDSKIVRVDPVTGKITDEIMNLTTAVDVAIDAAENIYVVEMATSPTELIPSEFDLYDPEAVPVHGGYLRFSGRVILYPADGCPPRVLAEGIDAPTNITIGPDSALYISTGQGTPGRPIPGPDGSTIIVGKLIRITHYLNETEK
ncbi:hypothetical protein MNBD_CHLOROFLEXI01-4305 [hydrothermal vent metagenome]|uniref:SMP-30/Gluconolactonase/LRE-like region domain-containing protein n=1 Tax=hydrothermal vent metagenome TaxID=652676 RepID=A0A3B0V3X8_9ZZZZ